MFDFSKAAKEILDEAAEKEEKKKSLEDAPTVLIAEDEAPNRETLLHMLGDSYNVLTAQDGEEALGIAEAHPEIAVVLTDHRMPRMTGVDLCAALHKRQHRASKVILTGFAELNSLMDAVNTAGVFRYLSKPATTDLIRSVVAEGVAQHQVYGENRRLVAMVKDLIEDHAHLYKQVKVQGDEPIPRENSGASGLLDTRKLELGVMFVDLRGFTNFSSQTSATEVVSVLQKIMSFVHQVVYDVGGIVDKHLGDGLMAVFGLTGQGGGPSGVQAMRRIVDGYPDLVAKLHPSDARGLRLSLGLAHGEVVMGMVGGESRKELAIIGQPANLASRLQEFSKVAIDPTQEDANPLGVFNHAMGICAPPLGDELKGIESVDLEGRIKVRDFSEIIRLNVIRS